VLKERIDAHGLAKSSPETERASAVILNLFREHITQRLI
jgi:hypothetical protein